MGAQDGAMRIYLRTMIENLVQGVKDVVRLEAHRRAFRMPESTTYTVGQLVFIHDHYALGTVVAELRNGRYRVETTTMGGTEIYAYTPRYMRDANLANLTLN